MPTFSTTFAPPSPPTDLALTADVPRSRVLIEWTATALGVDFSYYTVFRSTDAGATWIAIATLTPEAADEYSDFEAPLAAALLYRVTVTNTTGFESLPLEGGTELDVSTWWLVTPGDETRTFELRVVTGYDDVRPMQEDAYEPLGREKKLVIMGELLGHEGSIDVDLSREDAGLVEMIREASMHAGGYVLIKSPFGDVFRSHIGSARRTRQPAARQRITFDFVEIA
jgi:hypothetical protein